MPTPVRFALERDAAERFLKTALVFASDDDDTSDEEFVDQLIFAGM